ncbi:MAG: alpha-L-fucosidase [Muribaculaceae bacterium]|nr:alpha-L-fucosidase [Muribaculaceae bacterium]
MIKRQLFRFAAMMLPIVLAGTTAAFAVDKPTFVKSLTFPADATSEQKVEMAARLVPSPKQLEWQKLEMTAFLHFGVNTFTDREWGDGTESPAIFNPDGLDADQWVKVLKDAGFRLVILTAKHHDGFCLWPTATTSHSVASSPWKEGKGDVVADLRRACDKYGMKLGLYLSPWDRNASCYGDSPRYNDMFVAQLTELLTRYGKIDEVWFDGACGEGPNGKKQEYDWSRFKSVIEKLQPDAVVAIMGDDVRWVGNEKGMGRETEWSATALTPGIYPGSGAANKALGIYAKAPDLGGRDIVAKADKLYWWPSEVDVSIRPGWFYHDKELPKSLRQLAEIYLNSVGRNSVLLLNIPPDRHGRIAEPDVKRLAEFKAWIDANFSDNLAGEPEGLEVPVRPGAEVNTVVLGEDISKGQHVESFAVEALVDGVWTELAQGSTIGLKRIITFPAVKPEALRLVVKEVRTEPYIDRFEAYSTALPEEINVDLPGYRTVPPTDWSVTAATGPLAEAYKTFDDDAAIAWISPAAEGEKSVAVDMKRTVPVAGFVYEPRATDDKSGTVYHYRLELSEDGINWTAAPVSGEFSNIMHNPIAQKVYFPAAIKARYFRFTAVDEIDGRDFISVGELRIITPEPPLAAKDNETILWKNPGAPLALKPGDSHPSYKRWKFYTAHEFSGTPGTVLYGTPAGWRMNAGKHVSRHARIEEDCYMLRGGYLRMESHRLPEPVDNRHGADVEHSTYSCRTVAPADSNFWCAFTHNMRIEVRARRSSHTGLNDALWFMGNARKPWPANGEIDLMENPKATVNGTSHFTLHSENHFAGRMGAAGSTSANIDLADMADWNIYWIEWLPNEIRGGVNGHTYFHTPQGRSRKHRLAMERPGQVLHAHEQLPFHQPRGLARSRRLAELGRKQPAPLRHRLDTSLHQRQLCRRPRATKILLISLSLAVRSRGDWLIAMAWTRCRFAAPCAQQDIPQRRELPLPRWGDNY